MSLEVLHCGHLCCQQSPLIRPSLWHQSEERHFQLNTQHCSGRKQEPEPMFAGIEKVVRILQSRGAEGMWSVQTEGEELPFLLQGAEGSLWPLASFLHSTCWFSRSSSPRTSFLKQWWTDWVSGLKINQLLILDMNQLTRIVNTNNKKTATIKPFLATCSGG